MAADEGTLGRPGMVRISPQTSTTNSAPAASRTSRMLSTVGLQYEQTCGLGEPGREPAFIGHRTAGHDQSHGRMFAHGNQLARTSV